MSKVIDEVVKGEFTIEIKQISIIKIDCCLDRAMETCTGNLASIALGPPKQGVIDIVVDKTTKASEVEVVI